MDTRKVGILGAGNSNIKSTIANVLEKERGIEIVNIDNIKNNEEIVENSDLIIQQEQLRNSYPIHMIPPTLSTVNYHNDKRTDENRLKEYGIDSLDKLLEECILISQKQSKLPRSIRDIIVRISVEAFKELNMKAEEIKKESHNLTSLEEAKDRIIGEVGTERRDNYEKELKESL